MAAVHVLPPIEDGDAIEVERPVGPPYAAFACTLWIKPYLTLTVR